MPLPIYFQVLVLRRYSKISKVIKTCLWLLTRRSAWSTDGTALPVTRMVVRLNACRVDTGQRHGEIYGFVLNSTPYRHGWTAAERLESLCAVRTNLLHKAIQSNGKHRRGSLDATFPIDIKEFRSEVKGSKPDMFTSRKYFGKVD